MAPKYKQFFASLRPDQRIICVSETERSWIKSRVGKNVALSVVPPDRSYDKSAVFASNTKPVVFTPAWYKVWWERAREEMRYA